VSRFAEIPPPLKTTMTKMEFVEKGSYPKDWEPVFQTVRVPLAAFTDGTSGFDPAKLSAIRLRFDRSATAVICMSAIGIGKD
jgi:hypothetical protein